jgi:SAM-dependent methyltransferase
LNRDFIAKHWYASVYEQYENQAHDVDFLLRVLKEQTGGAPQSILEVACGGGRIAIPLAEAGHTVTGFDADEHMLLRCYNRMKGLKNIRIFSADATLEDWGVGYDVVVLAGNVLINIESDMEYRDAQVAFINCAAKALRPGGHLYLDFDLHFDPASVFSGIRESSYFNGSDDLGTTGRTVGYGGVFDPVTQICTSISHCELTTNTGEAFIVPDRSYKHIPTQAQVYGWLRDAGFTLERTYMNFTQEPIPDPITASCRATIWARKE